MWARFDVSLRVVGLASRVWRGFFVAVCIVCARGRVVSCCVCEKRPVGVQSHGRTHTHTDSGQQEGDSRSNNRSGSSEQHADSSLGSER
uniref:Putative secreted protein n=1 Tax=Anopheles marajoara TaxID=58244 RepID=A0A2M4CA59_9DIPT